ncbi:MAG: response regulator [Gammaproteobacteria bacterium]|nr:response regulator [Gammaproteobacteria bacterium]
MTVINRFGELRILLAEDSGMMLDLMKHLLAGFGCREVHAEFNGEHVAERYRDKRPDIVMLDINMPKKNGFVVLAEILAINPQAFVVIVSGDGTGKNVQAALQSGARDFVVKPYKGSRIEAVLDKYLAARQAAAAPGKDTGG